MCQPGFYIQQSYDSKMKEKLKQSQIDKSTEFIARRLTLPEMLKGIFHTVVKNTRVT